MKRNITTSIIAVCALLAIGLACGGGPKAEDEKDAGPEFVGTWTAADGSFITIRSDASADYKIGGTSVTGGVAKVSEKEKTLRIAMLGMGSPMKIDKAPANGEMTIDGIVYKKAGGGSTSSTSSDAKPTMPSDKEIQSLVRTTVNDAGKALKSRDFTEFIDTFATIFKQQATNDKVKEGFKGLLEGNASISIPDSVDASFSPAPAVKELQGMQVLHVDGEYPTTPKKLKFELKYVQESGKWKVAGISLDLSNS